MREPVTKVFRRAGCGKPARPVRRGDGESRIIPLLTVLLYRTFCLCAAVTTFLKIISPYFHTYTVINSGMSDSHSITLNQEHPNMPSKLKSETARINGAKSRGPKSPETRQKSSRNALDHGLTAASTIVLACEIPE